MQIRAIQTTWLKLENIVRDYANCSSHAEQLKRARKDMTNKLMAGVYRAVNTELQRMEMNSEVRGRPVRSNRVVLLVDIKIETEEFPVEPMYEKKSFTAEMHDILNKKSVKKLIEY